MDSRQVNRSVTKVFDQVRTVEGPVGVEAAVTPDVPGVGARGGVASVQGRRHRAVADRTGHSAVPRGVELPVPPVGGEPDLEVHSRRGRRRHPAEGGQLEWPVRARGRERTGGHGLCQCNRGVSQRETGQRLAGHRARRVRRGRCDRRRRRVTRAASGHRGDSHGRRRAPKKRGPANRGRLLHAVDPICGG